MTLPEDSTLQGGKYNPTLYYVVVASRENLEEAASIGQNMPDGLESPVFKVSTDGKTLYRVCCGCYTNKEEANETKALLKDYYYYRFMDLERRNECSMRLSSYWW